MTPSGESGEAVPSAPLRVTTAQLKQDAKLVTRCPCRAGGGRRRWLGAGRGGGAADRQPASFDSRNYGYATSPNCWRPRSCSRWPDEGTSQVAVRDKRQTKLSLIVPDGRAVNWLGRASTGRTLAGPVPDAGGPLAQQVQAGRSCAEVLDGAGAPVRFVPQAELPAGIAYEQFIFEQRRVPTRDGLHDFFNGLVWLHFPLTKQRLNRLQAAQIEADGVLPVRGRARWSDRVRRERGLAAGARRRCGDALRRATGRDCFSSCGRCGPRRAWCFSAMRCWRSWCSRARPSRPMSGGCKPLRVPWPIWTPGWPQDLNAERLAGKPFAHLPVLGVPGWWAGNEDPAFYDDAACSACQARADDRSRILNATKLYGN